MKVHRASLLTAFLFILLALPGCAIASETDGTIDSTNKYAKAVNSSFGSFNFGTAEGNVHVTDAGLTGYVWSDYYGWINLSPAGYGVINDGAGRLSGYAWGQNVGWVNFNPSSSGVRVSIDSSGDFAGYAWGQNVGWIVFNCITDSSCSSGSFKVSTDWRPASARGTGGSGGGGGGGGGTSGGSTPSSTPAPTPTETPAPAPDAVPEPSPEPPPPDVTPETIPETTPPESVPEVTPDQTETPQSDVSQADHPNTVTSAIAEFFGGGGGSGGGFLNVTSSAVQDVLGNAAEQVKESYKVAEEAVKVVAVQTKVVVQSPTGSVVTKTVSTVGVVGGGVATASSLFLNPLSFSEIFLIPFRLWGLLLAAFGLKKRFLPWGTVYDSVTKQPLDPAYVVLQDASGKEVNTSITDLDGRYGFLLTPGVYKIVANKTNYLFPSKKLAGKTSDELYSDLYFGEPITVADAGAILTKNIPLDPENFDWNEFAKSQMQVARFYSKRDRIKKRITDGMFSAGFFVAVIAFWAAPRPYNIAIFALYIVLLLLRTFGGRKKTFASVIETATDTPLAFAIVRIHSVDLGRELMHRVTDRFGRFYALVPPGNYSLTVEKKNPDETYALVYKSPVFEAKRGVIDQKIAI